MVITSRLAQGFISVMPGIWLKKINVIIIFFEKYVQIFLFLNKKSSGFYIVIVKIYVIGNQNFSKKQGCQLSAYIILKSGVSPKESMKSLIN